MEPNNEMVFCGKTVFFNQAFCDELRSISLLDFVHKLFPNGLEHGSETILLYQFIEGEQETKAFDFIIDVVEEGDGSLSAYFVLIKGRDIRQTEIVHSFIIGETAYFKQLRRQLLTDNQIN